MAGPPHGGPGRGRRQPPAQMDGLFVRHTYLTAVIGLVVQARFGIDIRRLAETDPADLLHGRDFRSKTGLQGIVESDFFAWPTEVGGLPLIVTLARRVARFDWKAAPNDIAAILYETVIPPDERRQLGEYYTPDWLARSIVREVVTDPLHQRVLDPACGSGTFVAEAVAHFIAAAQDAGMGANDVLSKAPGVRHRHRRPPRGRPPRPLRMDARRPARHPGRRGARTCRQRHRPHLPRRRPATTIPPGGTCSPNTTSPSRCRTTENTELVFPVRPRGARRDLRRPDGRRRPSHRDRRRPHVGPR